MPLEIGLHTTAYMSQNISAYIDGNYVYASCTLEASDRYPCEKVIYGDYNFVYKIIQDSDGEFLRFVEPIKK